MFPHHPAPWLAQKHLSGHTYSDAFSLAVLHLTLCSLRTCVQRTEFGLPGGSDPFPQVRLLGEPDAGLRTESLGGIYEQQVCGQEESWGAL